MRAAGLTQVELAELIGVSRSAVAQWETGRVGQMTINLARVAEALGVGVQDLVGDDKQLAPVPGDELTLSSLYRTLHPGIASSALTCDLAGKPDAKVFLTGCTLLT